MRSTTFRFAHGTRMSGGQALPPCAGCFETMNRLERYPLPHTQWSVNTASYLPAQSRPFSIGVVVGARVGSRVRCVCVCVPWYKRCAHAKQLQCVCMARRGRIQCMRVYKSVCTRVCARVCAKVCARKWHARGPGQAIMASLPTSIVTNMLL